MQSISLGLTINGEYREIHVEPWRTLLEVIRGELGLTGTKSSCETGHCGACSVILDGKIVKSCLVLAPQANGKSVVTIEGLGTAENLHPIQRAFMDHFAVQCGFCTPGMILTAKALLDENPSPREEEIKLALVGNLCRCTGYKKIVEAIQAASKEGR